MMQAFRNAAKPVVYLITITFLSWMILSLSGLTGGGGGFLSKTSVGSINGESVDIRAYQQAVQNELTRRQQASGNTVSLEETDAVRNEIWNEFVETALINEQIKQHHITTSPDEIAQWIQNVPPPEVQTQAEFQTNGTFDLTKYQRWLAGPVGQQYVPSLEEQSQDEILRQKLFADLTADVYLSDPALWQKYRDQNETASISLTPIIGRNIVPDSAVTVTSAEIQAYYTAHASEFARPRTAYMSFVAVSRRLDASDSAADLKHAQDVRSEISGTQTFADVAQRESSDTLSAKKGGALGEFTKGTPTHLDPAVEKAAFALPVNTVSDPILTASGYYLIEVTKKTGDKIDLSQIVLPIDLAGVHREQVDAELDSLQRLAAERANDPGALDTVARALKLPVAPTGPVPDGTRLQLGLYVIPDAGVWAFQAKVGETSPVIDADIASYVFRLDSVQAAGTPTLVQVRDAVAAKVRDQKKQAKAMAIAQDLIQRVKNGATLADASKALHLPNRDFAPFTRVSPPINMAQIVGAAFGLPVGALSGVLDTSDGLYVIKVLSRTPADSAKFVTQKDQLLAQSIRTARNDQVTQYLADLRSTAKIQDRRSDVFKTDAQNEAALAAQQGGTSK